MKKMNSRSFFYQRPFLERKSFEQKLLERLREDESEKVC